MKKEEVSPLLLPYALDELEGSDRNTVEAALRENASLRRELEEIQEGLEAEILDLPEREEHSETAIWQIKHRIRNEASDSDSQLTTGKMPRWYSWAGWGIAAVLAVTVLIQSSNLTDAISGSSSSEPMLAVFRLPDGLKDENGYDAGIREVLYFANGDLDPLEKAESMAEDLWLTEMEHRNKTMGGFVVLDIQGKQGFVGLTQGEDQTGVVDASTKTVWLRELNGDEKFHLGELPFTAEHDISGVYFFELDEEADLSAPDQWVPSISTPNNLGI